MPFPLGPVRLRHPAGRPRGRRDCSRPSGDSRLFDPRLAAHRTVALDRIADHCLLVLIGRQVHPRQPAPGSAGNKSPAKNYDRKCQQNLRLAGPLGRNIRHLQRRRPLRPALVKLPFEHGITHAYVNALRSDSVPYYCASPLAT